MASYNTVITNEGAALLASVIANQGTLTFSEMRFSTTDYDGVEQTLTVGTFGGVFITTAASGSVVDATTIKVAAQFDNSGIVGDHPLYSIGIVGTDGNTTALIAVCTTTNPDIIRAALTGVSTYAFNVNLAVSSTSNITVTGTTAAVLYDVDVVDTLISTATDKPLSANQGRVLNERISNLIFDNAGAHNRYRGKALTIDADFWSHISDGTFEDQFVGDTITINGRTYILAHANYWLHTGDTACETNHWVVVSPNMGNAKMNSDNSTVGGYLGSGLRSGTNHDSTSNTALANAIATIKSDFGASHILSHREDLDDAITSNYPSSSIWVDSEAELMTQIQVLGNRFFDPGTNLGQTFPSIFSVNKTQFALFNQSPELLTIGSGWWLRDVSSSVFFSVIDGNGIVNVRGASNERGIRVAFGIIA